MGNKTIKNKVSKFNITIKSKTKPYICRYRKFIEKSVTTRGRKYYLYSFEPVFDFFTFNSQESIKNKISFKSRLCSFSDIKCFEYYGRKFDTIHYNIKPKYNIKKHVKERRNIRDINY